MIQSQAPIMKISSLFICLVLAYANPTGNAEETSNKSKPAESWGNFLMINGTQDFESIEAGSTPSFTCTIINYEEINVLGSGSGLGEMEDIWWMKNEKKIISNKNLQIKMAGRNDTGNYTCFANVANEPNKTYNHTVFIRVIEPGKITGGEGARVNLSSPAIISCDVQGDPLTDFNWIKISDSEDIESLDSMNHTLRLNDTHFTMILNFTEVTRKDNGTYECRAKAHNGIIKSQRPLIVTEKPQVNIDFTKAVGAGSVYLNWTVNDRNDPIKEYKIQHMKNGTEAWQFYSEKIGGGNSSYIVKRLENNTDYQFKIIATNSIGDSHPATSNWVTTLEKDPEFIPTVSVKGTSIDSITIGWSAPPPELRDHVHYYKIIATNEKTTRESIYSAKPTNIYVFEHLESGTNYSLKVTACSEYTKKCGNWSSEQKGHTIDGVASPPQKLWVDCRYDNTTSTSQVLVTWEKPEKPNGMIMRYDIVLTGVATFRNDMGSPNIDFYGPNNRSVDGKVCSAVFDQVPLNTNYTVRVSGVTRLRTNSREEARGNCTMGRTIPSQDDLNRKSWKNIASEKENLFKIILPRMSERNGPICCYRVFIVKLGNQKTVEDLPPPKDISVTTYQEAYNSPSGGTYLADMFDSDNLVKEIFIGDEITSNKSIGTCLQCVGLKAKPIINLIPVPQTTVATSTTSFINTTVIPTSNQVQDTSARKKRSDIEDAVNNSNDDDETRFLLPEDGPLDIKANYTGFIEVMVCGQNPGEYFAAYSEYLEQRFVVDVSESGTSSQITTLGIVMQICIALLILVLIVLMAMCLLHKYLKHTREGGEEIISLRNSFRHLCRTLRGRHQLVASSPPDMAPIARSDLLQAYIDRHRDSDYGFQHEFELLPDRFADRTTRASESRENLYKNRYPDIKCYDQTRVRLSQIDGICGSDYINANFVLGYKERKKFICAQGPMENTVCDYWRMIWEQHLELVLMLTNLEEYSKTKCAKYWPDKSESKSFGDITVEHVRERPYSDYVVRELKMTRTGERDSRIIIQHHFLVWKDFMAPEHPHAILRFIKRVNEAYSLEKGPILVHCSAGVGRTGTLVALDSLLQQLTEEGQVSIFNTVCDLRHQRNFLVQSLKQYIFVYRALMEMAQFGDTEITAAQLKSHVDKLRQRENGKDKNKMEEEYEKISSVLEDRKSFSVGGGDENRIKNRNELVIPYDRNRVILTPVPGREHSTYINASFIEGYDNSESFIITQDPIESTIPDFWRMISEQCASTIVMLSDLSEGPRKCPRYWPDDEISYDHIRVRYIQSESCPYYTRRELCVLNSKTDESIVVTQYHYHGWPTVEGEVPEVTRGLIELVDQTIANDVESGGPLVVHCNCGSDRSSMFVALSILVQQLRTERRVDIFTTTKKLRSQRHGMIGSFAQYEFLHRAIVNYSDLHNLAEDDSAS